MLGPLQVYRGGRAVLIGSVKQRVLLGVLALQPDRVVGREELIDALWGAHPPRSCHGLIHTYIARLRRLLERPVARDPAARGVIVGAAGGYRLMAEHVRLDLLRFDALTAGARAVRAADPAAALELLAEALGRWRGRVLVDLSGLLDQHPAVVALAQRRTAAGLAYADLALELGQAQQAASQLGRLVHDEPLHEGLHARLMLGLAGSGQQAAALEVFAKLRGRLAGELGVEPGKELQEAQARVLRGDLPDSRPSHQGPAAGAARRPVPAQLPADVAGFTGRVGELEELDGLLSAGDPAVSAMVVTAIAGMAGVGKTALAVHWAHRVAGRFPDGQLYLDLRGWADTPPLDPLEALAVLLAGLGVQAHHIPVELDAAAGLYRSLLAGKRVLVVLDNAHDAAQVRPLLPGHPGCMVLITSRDRLTGLVATHGVHRLTLELLAQGEATALLGRLLGAAGAVAEPDAVEDLARRCAWLPLALRIAAANVTSLPGQTVAGYLAELQHGDRLAELAVDGDPHAAVQAAFDNSYRHLRAGSRRLFRLLGLVPGPQVSVAAAAALSGGSDDEAGRLLKGLVAAHLVEPRGPGRVGLHDLLRVYARQQSEQEDPPAERTAALERLHAWYLHAADTAARVLYPEKLRLPVPVNRQEATMPPAGFDDPASTMTWLETERASLVAAVVDAATHGPQAAAWLLADALRGYFWLQRHTTQWLQVARAGLSAATSAGDARAQAVGHLSLGDAHQAIGAYQQAIQHYTAALALARQAGWINLQAICLDELGMVQWWSGDARQAADHHAQALRLYRQTGRRGGEATALINHSVADRNLGQLKEAARRQLAALALHRQLGSRQGMANALGHLGATLHDLGRLDHARRCLTRALTLYREVKDRFGQTWVLCALAEVHRDTGSGPQALETAQAAVRLAGEIGHRSIAAAADATLASVHCCRGNHQQAHDHYRHALDLARQTTTLAVEVRALCGLAAAHLALGHHQQARSHAEQARTLATNGGFRVLEGQAHATLAAAHHTLGNPQQARAHAQQALELHRQTGHRLGRAHALRLLGQVMSDIGSARAARTCWQEALELLTDIGSPEADQLRELLGT